MTTAAESMTTIMRMSIITTMIMKSTTTMTTMTTRITIITIIMITTMTTVAAIMTMSMKNIMSTTTMSTATAAAATIIMTMRAIITQMMYLPAGARRHTINTPMTRYRKCWNAWPTVRRSVWCCVQRA